VSRDWLLYVDDIVLSAEKIGRLTRGRSCESFVADEAAFDAVLFNLQVIGEAVKNLPDIARASLPEVDWSGPARLRDFIAHHYFSVDAGIVWDAATNHVPTILDAARALLARFEST
jgi:uncharacterized protein with HEPN domain